MPLLTAGQIEAFWRTGFLAVERLTCQDDLGRIRRRLSTLFARFHELPGRHAFDLGDEGRHTGVQQIPEINWTIRLVPALKRTPTFRAARALAAELLGGPTEHTGFDHAILKPPHNGRATPWHQDGAYAGPDSLATTVHFWIPLHDVSLEMGCMQFIPGSHLGPILPHHRRAHRQSAHVMEVDGVDATRAVACPLRAGGATVHLPHTLHLTGPNMTDEPRLAWILEFGLVRPRAGWRAWLEALYS
ncbi:MAG: hypothetical protein AUH30_04280 [Candidatus Rokubacteria bacterium 13_1_40CM_68_15]|nr:MAG: hypothetical protein AUH30_04280 [Candidatus Rokubacteria bacterium 13_1_40CM_68_15]